MFARFFSSNTKNTETARLLEQPKKRIKNKKFIAQKPNYFWLTDEKILANIAEFLDINSLGSFVLTHKHTLYYLLKDITVNCKQETLDVLCQKQRAVFNQKIDESEDWFKISFGIYLASRITDCLITGVHATLRASVTKDIQLSILAPLVFQLFFSVVILKASADCTPPLSSFVQWLVGITLMAEIIAHPYIMGGVALVKDRDITRGQVYLGVAGALDALELLFILYLQCHARYPRETRKLDAQITSIRLHANKYLLNPQPSAQATQRITLVVDEKEPVSESARFSPRM